MRIVRFVDSDQNQAQPTDGAAQPQQQHQSVASKIGAASNKFRLWSSKKNIIERAPRFAINLETVVKVKGFLRNKMLGKAETVNISVSGAKLLFPEAIGFGTKLALTVKNPNIKEYINVDAHVVRCRRNYVAGGRAALYEIGLAFNNMSRRKATRLMKWVSNDERYGTSTFKG